MQLARLVGIVPLGIGLTVIGFLWLTPFNTFHSPPLFFRVFGSFIALAFVMAGGAILFAKLPGVKQIQHLREQLQEPSPDEDTAEATPAGGYQCPGCGAPLDSDADVSPHGDVKCEHCDRWFNIHGRI